VAALVIAVFEAVLVVLSFMHVRDSPRLTWAVVIGGVFWLGLPLALTMSDYLTRSCSALAAHWATADWADPCPNESV